MKNLAIQRIISMAIALVLVSLFIAYVILKLGDDFLLRMNSMPAADFIQYLNRIVVQHHSYMRKFIEWFVIGTIYVSIVELFAHVIGLLFKSLGTEKR